MPPLANYHTHNGIVVVDDDDDDDLIAWCGSSSNSSSVSINSSSTSKKRRDLMMKARLLSSWLSPKRSSSSSRRMLDNDSNESSISRRRSHFVNNNNKRRCGVHFDKSRDRVIVDSTNMTHLERKSLWYSKQDYLAFHQDNNDTIRKLYQYHDNNKRKKSSTAWTQTKAANEEEEFNFDEYCLRGLEHFYSREYCTRCQDIQNFVRTIITLYNYSIRNKKTSALSLQHESEKASKRSVQLAKVRADQDEADAKYIHNQQTTTNDKQLTTANNWSYTAFTNLWSMITTNHDHKQHHVNEGCPNYYVCYPFSTFLVTLVFVSVVAVQRLTINIF